jgi:hypothetical protein
MANCSFIKATDARNRARNDTLIWTEICEIQEAVLAAIDSNQYSTIVADGSPFTYTDALTSATLTGGGTGYTVTSATASITHPTGSGALLTPQVNTSGTITGFDLIAGGTGYAPVSVTASVGALYDLIDAQDETNYDGAGGNGTFTAGATYRVGEVVSLSEGSTATVDAISQVAVVQTALQDETDFDGQGRQIVDVGGNKAGATLTGLANDATVYNAAIVVDGGGSQPIAITGSAAQTYTDLLTELNADTTGATWELDPATGNLRARSTGVNAGLASSSIAITDTDLFLALTGFVAIDAAIGGDNIGTFNGGDGAGATNYVAGTTITMNDGSVINVDAIDANGDVTEFTIASGSTSSFSSAAVLTQASADSGGLGFTLTPDANNEIGVGPVTQFTIGSAGSVPFSLPSTVPQVSTTGIGTGFTITPQITANATYAGGEFLANDYTSLAFNDADPDTIVRTGGAVPFDTDPVGLVSGDRIRITNATNSANNGVYTIFSVTATTITLVGSDTLTADAADTTALIEKVGGTEAVLTPIVSSAGVITNVVINSPGTGYLLNQPILFTHPSGTGAVATITALNGSQGIDNITVSNGGSGYETQVAEIAITHPTGVDFEGVVQVQATEAILTITANGGNITNVTLIDGGAGYVNGTGFTFTITDVTLAGNSDGVIAYDVVNGAITNPTISSVGSGYVNATVAVNSYDVPDPTGTVAGVSIQNGGSLYAPVYPYIVVSDVSGTGAQINVTGVSAGAITSIQLADGGAGYSDGNNAGETNASVLIYNSDDIQNNTATITLGKDATSFGVDSTDYYSVLSGQATDAVIADQIQYVLDYFTALGYNIRAQVNPATGNTLQWQIIW